MKFRMTPVAAALATLFVMPSVSSAQEVSTEAAPTENAAPAVPAEATAPTTPSAAVELPAVKVQAQTQNEYKPEKPASPKYTEPLRDIPQTIQIIPARVIEDQNQLTLRDMLGNVPGITFGAAEGGNGFGDNITLRGARVDGDIFVDGIRDSAQTARVDPFNLEQLEVTKGASSVYSGAGAVSGTINMVSKTAKADEFTKATLGLGTDSYFRSTVDSNQKINDTTALRLNVMSHENDAPERDFVSAERWGVAGSLAFGLGTATRTTLNVVHQDNERVPDRGILWRRPAAGGSGEPVPVDRSTYFGWSNLDFEESTVDAITAIFERDIHQNLTLRNVTRHATTDNVSAFATVNGLVCIDGVPFNATGTCPTPPAGATSTFTMTGGPGNKRDDTTSVTANVTDLTWRFRTGTVEHSLVGGLAIMREDFDRTTSGARDPDGTPFTFATPNVRDLDNPDTVFTQAFNYQVTSRNSNEIDNQAIYLFHSATLSPQWELSAGARYERNEAIYDAQTFSLPADDGSMSAGSTTRNKASHHLKSGRLGVTFKPVEDGSVYVAVGNSSSPASSAVITSCSNTQTSQNCNVDPEKTINYEIGTKWEAFDAKLLLTAALFRNDRTNTRVASADPENPIQVLDGKSRVQGLELGASGQISKEWSISASYAYLDSEMLQGAADGAATDTQKGQKLIGTPEQSGSLWTTYAFPRGLEVGYGLRYVGEYNADFATATVPSTEVPDYFVHNALIGYQVDRNLHLRLNLNNLTDELYWTGVRPHGWGYPGEGRSYVLTASYDF
jgi:catecholate siderophore receptor